jgi:hypothetical protein
MRKAFAFVCLWFCIAGCGSSDTSNPVAACQSLANAACNKLNSCGSLGNVTVSECITAAETEASCSTASCPAGETFNSSGAATCVNDVNNASCPFATPASCTNLTPCQ